ncbi:MAG: UPF0182 family protein [Sandaracinaceae bacterium]
MRKRRLTAGIATTIVAVALVFLAPALAALQVDLAWYESVGHPEVFLTPLVVRLVLGLVVGVVVAVTMLVSLRVAVRASEGSGPLLIGVEEQGAMDVGSAVPRLVLPASLLVGLLAGLAGSGAWRPWLLFTHAVPFGEQDPVFGRDVAFYVFQLPLYDIAWNASLALLVVIGAATLGTYLLRGAVSLDRGRLEVPPGPRLHLAILGALLLLTFAFGAWLATAHLVLSQEGLVAGAGYTDVHARLPVLRIQMALAAVAAVAVLIGGLRGTVGIPATFIGLYLLVAIFGRGLYPAAIQTWVVEPNELEREREYLEHEIRATRSAYGIADAAEAELDADPRLSWEDVEANRVTIENIRLWDHRPLLSTFGQIQEIRTYYEFSSVDNDRYLIDGSLRQTMLSPRELVSNSLPNRTWINEHFTFTHGYGLTLGPVNQATNEGLPVLYVKDIPPASTIGDIQVTRPQIYYGEETTSYAFVRTNNREFDHPSAEGNVYTDYSGRGGIRLDSSLLRASLALHLSNLKILLSDDLEPDSRVMLHRQIRERVSRVAPFLDLDQDPYLVVRDDGRLSWIFDAYTTTRAFPYARRVRSGINYIRNAVKAVVDAYDGSVTLYTADDDDPILRAWRGVFPELFVPMQEMPEDLRSHLRYPLDIFHYQAEILAIYHLDDADLLYNREDQWQIPTLSRGDRRDPMEPYYTVMRLPNEEQEEFILMLPFTPARKANLAAWMVARSDGDHLGELVVYRFPNDRLVFGPQQVLNRINQDADISAQLSLWDQRGSEANLGTLLVIPIEESLIYVLPLYLRSEGGQIPQLKRVIVVYRNRIAMRETLDAAVAEVFQAPTSARPSASSSSASEPAGGDPSVEAVELNADVRVRALQLFEGAVQAQREGDWAGYGERLRELEATLRELQPPGEAMAPPAAGEAGAGTDDGPTAEGAPNDAEEAEPTP